MGFPTQCDSSHSLGTLTLDEPGAKTGQMFSCINPEHGSRNRSELSNPQAWWLPKCHVLLPNPPLAQVEPCSLHLPLRIGTDAQESQAIDTPVPARSCPYVPNSHIGGFPIPEQSNLMGHGKFKDAFTSLLHQPRDSHTRYPVGSPHTWDHHASILTFTGDPPCYRTLRSPQRRFPAARKALTRGWRGANAPTRPQSMENEGNNLSQFALPLQKASTSPVPQFP